MDIPHLDRSALLIRARRQRRVLSVAAVLSGAMFVVIMIGIGNALAGGSVHWPLLATAVIVGGTAVPAASTARRLGSAIRDAEAERS